MAGINFRVTGQLSISAVNTSRVACLILPNNSRRILLKEISVTAADPNKNGGFLNVRLSSFSDGGTGMSTGTFLKDPNILESIGAVAAIQTDASPASVEPTEVSAYERQSINVAGGLFLWVAIREEDKHPVSGGNSSGIGKERIGLIFETDAAASEVTIDYVIRGEY